MAKRTRYSEYHDRYANYRLELSDDGILLMQCHTNGGSLVWDWRAHDQMSDAFADIAGDREIKVLIHTGTGENYNANWGRMPNGDPVEKPDYLLMPGTRGLHQARRKGLVCQASDHQCARRRCSDDQRRQRSVQHALGGTVARRYRAGLRRRLLPGRVAFPPRPGARRRPTRDLEFFGRPYPRPLFPADRHEARRAGSQGVGRGQRGAAQRPRYSTGLGNWPANWSSAHR